MGIKSLVAGFVLGSFLAVAGVVAKDAPRAVSFPQEKSDLKPESTAVFGKCENGLRYVVLPNREPHDRASLRLLVMAGSLDEREDERGLAHFLEHMAFNGSSHYAPGTLVEFFQRMGMRFGADVNANTSQDRTVYLLELAHADNATVGEGLKVFGDYASGLLLRPDQVEKERGIIVSERRAQDSPMYRSFVAQHKALLSTTLLPQRMPIGDPEVIQTLQRERFVDFWNAWYRPERMVLVAVGDFPDVSTVEKAIRENFAALASRGEPRPDPDLGQVPAFDGVRTFYHAEPEQPLTGVSITEVRGYTHEADTAALRQGRLPRELAMAMLNRRLAILSKKENAPFTFAFAGVFEEFDFVRTATLTLLGKAEQWRAALATGEQELRRALEHGFTASELAEAVADQRNKLEQDSKTAATRQSTALADRLVETLLLDRVFLAPADELALIAPALAKVKPEDCLAALRAAFGVAGRLVAVTGNAKIDGDAASVIAEVYRQSNAIAVSAPAAETEQIWGYTDFGKPGEIKKREHIADLDVELVEFANGSRLNLKKTPFEAGRIQMSASVGNGTMTEPRSKRGLASIAASAFAPGGLGKHSADDLQKLFAGRNVEWQFDPQASTFMFRGATTPNDLLLQFQWLAAGLTDPGYRSESLRVAQKQNDFVYNMFQHTAMGPMALQIGQLLSSGDSRFVAAPREAVMARTLDEVKEWLGPQLNRGALEVSAVGDLNIEETIKAAAQTIGALPTRDAKPDFADLKKVTLWSKPFAKDFPFDSEIPKGAAVVYWPTDDGLEVHRLRRLNYLADILGDRLRLRLREALGETYSPQVISRPSDTYPGYGYLSANIDVDPSTARRVADIIVDVADDIRQNGVSDDELKRAKEPTLAEIKRSSRDNAYWLGGVLARAQEFPEWLDWARDRSSDHQSISAHEISALAAKYFPRERASRAIILPAKAKEKAIDDGAQGH